MLLICIDQVASLRPVEEYFRGDQAEKIAPGKSSSRIKNVTKSAYRFQMLPSMFLLPTVVINMLTCFPCSSGDFYYLWYSHFVIGFDCDMFAFVWRSCPLNFYFLSMSKCFHVVFAFPCIVFMSFMTRRQARSQRQWPCRQSFPHPLQISDERDLCSDSSLCRPLTQTRRRTHIGAHPDFVNWATLTDIVTLTAAPSGLLFFPPP